MHFPVKFRPYVSVFDKVRALLILWELDRGIVAEFHNNVKQSSQGTQFNNKKNEQKSTRFTQHHL